MPAISSSQQTLDQRRARHAWEAVDAFAKIHVRESNGKRDPDKEAKKYATHAKKLPTRILTAGLGQALAFLKAKGYAPDLLMALSDWVLDKRLNKDSKKPRPADDALLHAIVNGNSDELRRWTDESLAYLQWLNRWVESIIGVSELED
jgi:CRISPR-associated protein Cmr5